MSIETVGGLKQILGNYDAGKWTKSANLELKGFNELDSEVFKSADNRQSFSEMLSSSIQEVNGLQQEADKAIQKLVTGESKNLHETLLAVEKADIAFKAMNQVRMKVIDAYKEVMRMQV
jgi:flagellar hook-basal body complex protein FliE